MVKFYLFVALLIVPVVAPSAFAQDLDQPPLPELEKVIEVQVESTDLQEPPTDTPDENDINWVDTSHAYATDRTQELTEWMDRYFGDPLYDLESAESLVRLQWEPSWDEEDEFNAKLRLRGKLQLPRISKRLNLVFSGEIDDLGAEDIKSEDDVGLQYNVGETSQSRLDLTLGITTSSLRPGVRFRNQGPIVEGYRYRYTQQLQYESDEGFYTTGEVDIDHLLAENKLLRWSNQAVYGEETAGTEWRSRLSLRQRISNPNDERQYVFSYFGSVRGVTDSSLTKNTRVGVQLRSQVYRQFIFVEVEPSYNFRKQLDEDRNGVWNIVLRIEIALERDLRSIILDD